MNRSSRLWAAFAALGVLLWLSSLGVGVGELYRSALMIAMLSWGAWFAGTGDSARAGDHDPSR